MLFSKSKNSWRSNFLQRVSKNYFSYEYASSKNFITFSYPCKFPFCTRTTITDTELPMMIYSINNHDRYDYPFFFFFNQCLIINLPNSLSL